MFESGRSRTIARFILSIVVFSENANSLMKTPRVKVSLGVVLIANLMVATACNYFRRASRRATLPYACNVEYTHGARILTLVLGKHGVHYSLSELRLNPVLLAKDGAQSGHWFEIAISGSSRLVGPPSDRLVLDLTHEIINGRLWHFPLPLPSSDSVSPNASFDVVIWADGYVIRLPRHYQGQLKRTSPSDETSYEAIITEISREDFVRIANSTAVTVQFASLASFDLDSETIAALRDFATRVNGANQSHVEAAMQLISDSSGLEPPTLRRGSENDSQRVTKWTGLNVSLQAQLCPAYR